MRLRDYESHSSVFCTQNDMKVLENSKTLYSNTYAPVIYTFEFCIRVAGKPISLAFH